MAMIVYLFKTLVDNVDGVQRWPLETTPRSTRSASLSFCIKTAKYCHETQMDFASVQNRCRYSTKPNTQTNITLSQPQAQGKGQTFKK
jgi:hypothetical protein